MKNQPSLAIELPSLRNAENRNPSRSHVDSFQKGPDEHPLSSANLGETPAGTLRHPLASPRLLALNGYLSRQGLNPPAWNRTTSPALKHSRYPWKSRVKRMTIAAGFMHRDGILLCSDTQQEAGTNKFNGPKAGIIDIPYGKIAFAFAGHADFATTAIQACGSRLKSVPPDDTIRVLIDEVESEYRRLVFSHPNYSTDHNLQYWLLISLWQKSTESCSLWVAEEHSLHNCFEAFRAVGIGTDLANVLVRPFIADRLSEMETLTLMAFMMARVKDNVPGCGGISQYIAMGNDGNANSIFSISLDEVERVSALYDKAAHDLLLSMNIDDDGTYNRAAMNFISQALIVRDNWKRIRKANPEVRRYLGLTRDERLRQPPLPESP